VRNGSRLLLVLAIILSTIACDRVSKRYAERALADRPRRSYLGDTLRVQYTENAGAFLSLGAQLPPRVRLVLLGGAPLVLLAGVGLLLVRRTTTGALAVGLSLLWAGGASNLADRVERGRVVDFLNVGIGGLRTGIFNVADMAITFGGLMVLAASRRSRTEAAAGPEGRADAVSAPGEPPRPR
jgi:signal peptidase II